MTQSGRPSAGASPYSGLPANRFWKTGVSEQHPLTVSSLYRKRFSIAPTERIATAGSCFAQHIGRHLRKRGFSVIDAEPCEDVLADQSAQKFGYRIFSARYGNIYTTRQLRQLAAEAFGMFEPANSVWEKGGRYFDAMRPSVEPNGLRSPEHVRTHRERHLGKVRQVFSTADIFVFTFGLTECWTDKKSGTVYPTAPGTIAGSFDPDTYAFKNFTHAEILDDFIAFRDLVRARNKKIKFLLTVSPVPLTATATENHVLVATTYSKSVLRAVAGQLFDQFDDVDYFPSYELIASPFSKGFFYESNLRSVSPAGVEAVMQIFFSEHAAVASPEAKHDQREDQVAEASRQAEDVVCEDVLLEAFAS